MAEPLTVLMAVYNGQAFMRTAIESILAQTYRSFRFLIVDDASTDGTCALIRSYEDPRIELLALERNIGQTAALNVGVRHATTPWIGRMDADDYSAPTRFEQQMHALVADTTLRCIGTQAWEFRDDPQVRGALITRPPRHADIQRAALEGAAMIHGTIVVSRAALLDVGAYDERFRFAADRALFVRLFSSYRAANLAEPLLGIRRHPRQDSFSKVAADEYIQIFSELLASDRFPAAEQQILKRSLAFAHLFRARYFRAARQYRDWSRDLWQALELSPGTWCRQALDTLSARWLPTRVHAVLRRRLARVGG